MRHLEVAGLDPVSVIGLGTWQFGSKEWGYGDAYANGAAHDIVRRALDLGVTLFDTAEVYGLGRSERILGDALGAQRSGVVLATKLFPVAPFPALVRRSVSASASRLGVTRIPLYQVHQPNPLVPDTVPMPALGELVQEGTIGAVGVSNYSLARWRKADAALAGHGPARPVVSNQVQFSLAHAGPLDDLVPFAERENRLVIAYSPLAQGLLGGRYGPDHKPGGVRAVNPLFGSQNLERVTPLLDLVREVAAGHDTTPSRVALAWLIAQPRVVVIPGASSVEQLESNVAAAELTLAPDEIAALTRAAREFRPVGGATTLVDGVRSKIDSWRGSH